MTETEKRFFSYSKILDYSFCPRKYYWRNVLKISPKAKSKALALGSCMSDAMQAYRTDGTFESASTAFSQTWADEGKCLKLTADPEDPKDFRTVERGLEILSEYIKIYPDEHKRIIKPEVSFELDAGTINGITIILNGRLDGIIENDRGDVEVIEDKTTSRLGPKFFDPLRGSLQIGLYLYAAEQYGLFDLLGKRSTPACLMNAIKIHEKDFKFSRDVAIKSRRTLSSFKDNAMNWVCQMLWAENENRFPMNDIDNSACTKYGGCDYLPLKHAGSNIMPILLKNSFCKKEKIDDKYVSSPIPEELIEEIMEE